jgi:hypothetical protein
VLAQRALCHIELSLELRKVVGIVLVTKCHYEVVIDMVGQLNEMPVEIAPAQIAALLADYLEAMRYMPINSCFPEYATALHAAIEGFKQWQEELWVLFPLL